MQLFHVSALLATAITIASATSPVAFNPLLTVNSLIPQQPSAQVANGYLQLTPDGCSTSSTGAASKPASKPASGSDTASKASSGTQTCTGFQVSNDAAFNTKVNSAVFTPAQKAVVVDPMRGQIYELGTVTLTNNGFMQPTGAAMALVAVKGSVTFSVPGLNEPTNLPIEFQVMWTLGSPAPANTAGLFALSTKNPAPSFPFKVAMSTQVEFSMNLKIAGFIADEKLGSNVEVLGDWGQAKPKTGEPGPRVYVEQGPAQVVKLYGQVTNTAASTG